MLQMRPNTQSADKQLGLVLHSFDTVPVQMVPVVMGDQVGVDLGHLLAAVHMAGSLEGLVEPVERGGIVENRIHQKPFALHLQKIGGMAEPHPHIFIGGELAQVGFSHSQRMVRHTMLLFFPENKVGK